MGRRTDGFGISRVSAQKANGEAAPDTATAARASARPSISTAASNRRFWEGRDFMGEEEGLLWVEIVLEAGAGNALCLTARPLLASCRFNKVCDRPVSKMLATLPASSMLALSYD